MAAEILKMLLIANLAAAGAILLVLLLRRPLRRMAGPGAAYMAWLAVPLAAAATFIPAAPEVVTLIAPSPSPAFSQAAGVIPAPADPSGWALALWLAGAIGAAGVVLSRQKRALAQLGRMSHRAGDPPEFYRAAGTDGPAVVGAVRPRVIVPADFEARFGDEERRVILAHETEHLIRGDVVVNAICAAGACLNWFNPLIHVALVAIRVDQELACDAAVVERYPAMRRLYGGALLRTQLAGVSLPLGCYWPGRSTRLIHDRLKALAFSSPGPLRRLAGTGVIGAVVLGSAVTAWAAQPRPTLYVTVGLAEALKDEPRPVMEISMPGLSIDVVRGEAARKLADAARHPARVSCNLVPGEAAAADCRTVKP